MCHKQLMQIYLHLSDVLKQLSKTSISLDFCESSLKEDISELDNILRTDEIDEQCKTIIGMIYETANSIKCVINIRTNLKARLDMDVFDANLPDVTEISSVGLLDHFNSSQDPGLDSNSNSDSNLMRRLNKLCQTTSEAPPSIPLNVKHSSNTNMNIKRKRLPKNVVEILNSWYNENIDYPYLTKDDITELRRKTGLTENQIKNWASNRRRKKSEDYVSEELRQLLA